MFPVLKTVCAGRQQEFSNEVKDSGQTFEDDIGELLVSYADIDELNLSVQLPTNIYATVGFLQTRLSVKDLQLTTMPATQSFTTRH